MTENEIKWNLDGVIKYLYKKNELGGDDSEKQYQVDNSTIDLLEELQQYRAIGTVGRFQQLVEQFKPHVTDKTSCPHRGCNKCDMYRKENEKYHEIGTVEECREARERQRGKKPEWSPDCEECEKYGTLDCTYKCGSFSTLSSVLVCPNCKKQRVIKEHGHRYCHNCGQSIDWSDTQ